MTTLTASTLGAPDDDLATVLSWLALAGVPGVELRVAPGQIAHPGMAARECVEVRAMLADAGIELTGLASYVKLCSDASDGRVIGELAERIIAAHGPNVDSEQLIKDSLTAMVEAGALVVVRDP